jgi:spermidine synthase
MLTSKEKWFCEKISFGKRAGKLKHCFFIDKLVFKGETNFQEVLIFDNSVYGRILCLDKIIQFSKLDEFIYHEMMVHPVLFSHPKPENVLIIGGGDGGTLREVLKHSVKKVDLVEIDKRIIELSKKYLKFVCKDSFSNKKVNIYNIV